MFDNLSKLAKAGAKLLKDNQDKINDVIKIGANIALDKDQKGIAGNVKDIIQEALNNISPLKIDVDGSLNEQSILISEESLNNYLKEKIVDIEGLKNLDIKVYNDNLLFITGEATKSLLTFSFSQKLKLTQFKMNDKEGFVEFSMIGDPDLKATSFVSQIVLFITRSILKYLVSKNLIEVMNENNIELKNNKLLIDLKSGPAKKFYTMDINTILERSIPVIGTKKVIDLISIKEVSTKDKAILIDLGLSII